MSARRSTLEVLQFTTPVLPIEPQAFVKKKRSFACVACGLTWTVGLGRLTPTMSLVTQRQEIFSKVPICLSHTMYLRGTAYTCTGF